MQPHPTAQLLDLALRAQNLEDREQLSHLLTAGHRLWCQGIAQTETALRREVQHLSDAQLAAHCTAAGTPWEAGTPRAEAVSLLAFARWDASPAAIAYTELADHAARFGACLLPEETR